MITGGHSAFFVVFMNPLILVTQKQRNEVYFVTLWTNSLFSLKVTVRLLPVVLQPECRHDVMNE